MAYDRQQYRELVVQPTGDLIEFIVKNGVKPDDYNKLEVSWAISELNERFEPIDRERKETLLLAFNHQDLEERRQEREAEAKAKES